MSPVKPKSEKTEKQEKPEIRGCVDCTQRGRIRHAWCDVVSAFVKRKQPTCAKMKATWRKK